MTWDKTDVIYPYHGSLTHCGLVTLHGNIWVNIGSGYGLVHDDTKPLPEPTLI